ncbi:MAG: polyprenyl synthetase family protein [Ruminococcaceae bacterium]|nr:polyprenyl synthetase family protein [Oscillospiraceae bacterium]MBQ9914070.1 polyprenyl synthetase family protein [Clostridia bacterium]
MNQRLNEYIGIINRRLSELVPECDFGEDIVHEAMKYSLSIGGKRIRPVLVLEFCRICGGSIEDAVDFACALEMVHTYSLIHDDLPCMDDDELRRGMPACHVKFGEAYALLAGDGLLTRAFGVLANSSVSRKNPTVAVNAVSALSYLSGCNGMIGGQVIDLVNESKEATIEVLETLDRLKTGALIRCSAVLGCLCAGADGEKTAACVKFAEKIGHAFQVVDDILDVVGNEQELGKPIGSDADNNKSTYVALLGLEKSKELAVALTDEAIEAIGYFGEEAEFLKDLAVKLTKRSN